MNRLSLPVPFALIAGLTLLMAAPAAAAPAEFDFQKFIDERAKAGEKRIVIPPGQYRARPEKRQHLLLADLADLEIVAEGVEMVCTENTRAVTFAKCRNVTLRGLTIDYDPLPFTQGRIVAMSEDKGIHEIELTEGYPDSAGVTRDKYEIYDPATRVLRFGSYHNPEVEIVDARHIRVKKAPHFIKSPFKPEQVGDIIVIERLHHPGGSIPHAVYLELCANVRLEDVTLHASHTFGFMESECEKTTYLRCVVDRRPAETDLIARAEPRIRSLNADAFHSSRATVGPQLVGCLGRYMGDDGVNIHGDYDLIMGGEGARLRVLAKRSIQIRPGDEVELVAPSGERLPNARVVAVEEDGKNTAEDDAYLQAQPMFPNLKTHAGGMTTLACRVTLDREVKLPRGSLICPIKRLGDGFLVEDCEFGPNRSRGILIKASHGRAVNNRLIDNWGEAVKIAGERFWLEAGNASDVLIEGNTITDCHAPAIAILAEGEKDQLAPAGAHENIVIRNNTITGGPLPSIFATSVRGLILEGNSITPDPGREMLPSVARKYLGERQPAPVIQVNCAP